MTTEEALTLLDQIGDVDERHRSLIAAELVAAEARGRAAERMRCGRIVLTFGRPDTTRIELAEAIRAPEDADRE